MPIEIAALPRTAVQQWLGVVRLPLTAVTALARRTGDQSWPPALAFEAFEARVKALVGTVLHDDQLRESADAQQVRIARLRDAETFETAAERKRAAADRELQERRQSAQKRATKADERADEQAERLEDQEAAVTAKVERDAAAKRRALQEDAQAKQKRIDDQSLAADQRRIRAERDALAKRRRAVKAKGRALELDKATKATTQRRKSRP